MRLEGKVFLHLHVVVGGRRSVCGRGQYRISSVSSVVPEVHVLAIRLAILEGTSPVAAYAGVSATCVVVAVVSSAHVVIAVMPSTRVVA